MTPREALARQLWLKSAHHREERDWPGYFAWYEREIALKNLEAAANSAIGKCVAQSERILRLCEAAGARCRVPRKLTSPHAADLCGRRHHWA